MKPYLTKIMGITAIAGAAFSCQDKSHQEAPRHAEARTPVEVQTLRQRLHAEPLPQKQGPERAAAKIRPAGITRFVCGITPQNIIACVKVPVPKSKPDMVCGINAQGLSGCWTEGDAVVAKPDVVCEKVGNGVPRCVRPR